MDDLPDADHLFQNAACGLLVLETNGAIRRANATFCEWLGFGEAEVLSHRLSDLLSVGARIFHQTHWSPLMQIQGSVSEVALDAIHREGHKVPMLFNARRRRHGDRVLDFVAVVVVTDRQKYEAELLSARTRAEAAQVQLKQVDARKDEFLATLAHELRNPLAPMRNVLEVLKRKSFDDAQTVWAHEVLDRQLGQMTLLVDDLMDVSRITHGKLVLKKEFLGLQAALDVAVEAARPLMASGHHGLDIQYPAESVFVHADPTRVTQMVLNLLNNAARYTPAGGHIWLTVRKESDKAVVTVRDTGVGLSEESRSEVFKMFSQVTPAAQRTAGGLGIGLALVKGLAELHGGTAWVDSDGPGLGSEFAIELPLSEHSGISDSTPAASVPSSPALRILVVDDNADAADSIAMLLESDGHLVTVARDGLAAVQAGKDFRPELILLDLGLPEIDGFEAARRIRSAPWGRNVVLVALTGWGQAKDVEATRAAGFDDHATKPIALERLERLVAMANSRHGKLQ